MDLEQHLIRQMVFSHATFGPGARTEGVLDHIKKEIEEVRAEAAKPVNSLSGRGRYAALEWVDLVILSLDGLTRELWANGIRSGFDGDYKATADTVAEMAQKLIMDKQARNERRDWPDWRTADPDKAIEHVRPTTGEKHE